MAESTFILDLESAFWDCMDKKLLVKTTCKIVFSGIGKKITKPESKTEVPLFTNTISDHDVQSLSQRIKLL